MLRTYRFRSSFRASGFTPTKFRSMRDIRSSLNTTISCPKNFNRHGLLVRCTFGIFDRSRAVNEERRGFRGRTELTVRSRGPGTKTKCVLRVMSAYEAIRSARESKPSDLERRNYPMTETRTRNISNPCRGLRSKDAIRIRELALISLDISAVPLCDPRARKVAAKDDHLWNEVVLNAVVKYPLKTVKRVRLV